MDLRRPARAALVAVFVGACSSSTNSDPGAFDASLAAPGQPSAGAASPGNDSGRPTLGGEDASTSLPTGKFRIGMWCGPPAAELTKARFDEIAAAGLTTVAAACDGGSNTPAYNTQLLALAKASGLDAIVADTRTRAAMNGVDIDQNLDAVVADYAKEPALAGYHVVDEPGAGAFSALAQVTAGLAARDAQHFAYINLLPNYAVAGALGVPDYDTYVGQFLSVVKPKVFSYDFYPFMANGSELPGFFSNLATVRAHALATSTPFWQFVQSISFNDHRPTNQAEKLWVGTQTLAYGGAGISYFTYFTPPQTAEQFGSGIIDPQGQATTQYAEIKANNAKLAAWGRYLVAAKSTAVFHNGSLASGSGPREPGMPVYLPNAAPITVGLFASPAGTYAFLANRDYRNAVESDVYLAAAATDPEVLDVATGTFVPMTVVAKDALGTKVHVSLSAGDGALILLRGPVSSGPLGAEAFVGTVRADAGTLSVVDGNFGAAPVRGAGWNDCPSGYDVAGRDLQSNGFWLCVRKDLAAHTFLVGNVVADAGTLYSVTGGTASVVGVAGWDTCPSAKFLGRWLDSNGFWLCIQ